jgi:REP element-mobilizing transposase RayT
MLGRVVVGATVPGRPRPPAYVPGSATASHVELSEIGQTVDAAIRHNNRNGVSIQKYVIMPNHVHMIVTLSSHGTGDRGRSPLQMIVRNMKAYVTKQIGFSLWQRSYHDHIIRSEDEYLRIMQYIEENPAKWREDCYFIEEATLPT